MTEDESVVAQPMTASHPSPTASTQDLPVAGDVFDVPHPFLWEAVSLPPDDPEGGYREAMSWRPGVQFKTRGGYADYCGETVEVINGRGAQILTVIDVFKPGRFPTRVFYTRRWRDPAGKEFGKGKLHIKTLGNFREIVRGYRHQHEVEIVPTDALGASGAEGDQATNHPGVSHDG